MSFSTGRHKPRPNADRSDFTGPRRPCSCGQPARYAPTIPIIRVTAGDSELSSTPNLLVARTEALLAGRTVIGTLAHAFNISGATSIACATRSFVRGTSTHRQGFWKPDVRALDRAWL
jgi:hypothetical protein